MKIKSFIILLGLAIFFVTQCTAQAKEAGKDQRKEWEKNINEKLQPPEIVVETIISKTIEALGGEDAIKEIKSLKLSGIWEFSSSDVKYNLTIYKMYPNRYRYEAELRGINVIEAYDGDDVWHISPWDGINSPTIVKDEVQASKIKSDSFIFSPLVDWKTKGYKVEYLGKLTDENLELLKLKVTFKDNYTIDYFIDSGNYLPTKFARLERHNPRANPKVVTTHISDYRRISNVLLAHRFVVEKGPQKWIITIKHIDINPSGVTSSIFSMK
jgi:hypothetical protein